MLLFLRSSYLLFTTTSYSLIAACYLVLGAISLTIRSELNTLGFYVLASGSWELYNGMISCHGLGMVFLFLMPILVSFVGNWMLPTGFSLADFASPRLNMAGLHALMLSIMLVVLSISREEGLVAGWTIYPPLSDAVFSSSSSTSLAILALHIMGLSSELGVATFLVTAAVTRLGGHPLAYSCLITWSVLASSAILIVALPVLGSGITLLLLDRLASTGFVNGQGPGDPLVFQHLFWYFGHPEVYVLILPAFGIVSWALARATRVAIPGHPSMLLALQAIALVGGFVWAHHMFVAGMSTDTQVYFSGATLVIGIPTAVKIFTWLSITLTLRTLDSASTNILAFLACFLLGGFTGLLLGTATVDALYHDTYFVVGHFHYVLSIASVLSIALLLRVWYQVSLASSHSEVHAKTSLLALLAGANWLFLLQHWVGIAGQPRRIFTASELHQLTTEAANAAAPMLLTYLALQLSTQSSPSTTHSYSALCVTTSAWVSSEVVTQESVDRGYSVHEV